MASAAVEKTAEDLRKEIAELQRQQWEITERLRNPRGLRRTAAAPGLQRPRGVIRPASELEEQPAHKKRLSSAVVKMDGEVAKDDPVETKDTQVLEAGIEIGTFSGVESNRENLGSGQINGGFRRDGNFRLRKMDYDAIPTETVPRVLPKEDDPNLVKRNRRMLGQLLGTLEKFREEDKQLSSTEAYMRRSDSLKRAEQKAREESERLRQQEREQISEKRRRDLTLRARVAAKAEEKKLELLFLFWAEHHKKLSNFLRTKAEPPIYYMPTKPLVEDAAVQEQRKEQAFEEWKSLRRKELSKYQKQIEENYISNVDREIERWQNARNARRSNNLVNLQESMDKDLDTHRLEHGPKTRMRNIAGGDDHEDEDVEDINIVEDELMDEVLDPHDRPDQLDPTKLSETDDVSLVVVLLDADPFFWATGACASGENHPSTTLPFAKFLNHVILFLNSILLLNQLNQVVLIATGINSCGYIYDSSSSTSERGDKVMMVQSEIMRRLQEFLSRDMKLWKGSERGVGSSVSSLLSGSLSLSLCYIQKVFRSGTIHPQPRILCLQASPDGPEQYVAVMNAIFSAQRSMVPIDSCVVGVQHSAFLQQASHITGGVYLKPSQLDGLFQYLAAVFAADLQSRNFLQLPKPAGVDFRASCFCHKKTIDMGYVCSVCLSIFCNYHKKCSTCGSEFNQSPPDSKA